MQKSRVLNYFKKNYQKLNAFQLVNLFNNRVNFLFIDLYGYESNHPQVKPLLEKSKRSGAKGAIELAKAECIDTQYPIVLAHRWPYISYRVYKTLILQGYLNVYILEGGTHSIERFFKGEEIGY